MGAVEVKVNNSKTEVNWFKEKYDLFA